MSLCVCVHGQMDTISSKMAETFACGYVHALVCMHPCICICVYLHDARRRITQETRSCTHPQMLVYPCIHTHTSENTCKQLINILKLSSNTSPENSCANTRKSSKTRPSEFLYRHPLNQSRCPNKSSRFRACLPGLQRIIRTTSQMVEISTRYDFSARLTDQCSRFLNESSRLESSRCPNESTRLPNESNACTNLLCSLPRPSRLLRI